jgi:hypothetical protein
MVDDPMSVGVLTLDFLLPGCTSLKEKRGRIKPLLAYLHREFNLSAAEVDRLDAWQEEVIACALVGNDPNHVRSSLDHVAASIPAHFSDLELLDHRIELL